MASWKWPNVLNKMLSDIPGINVLLNALLKQDVSGTTDVPTGAKQWVDTPEGKQFQVFNGQSWSSVGKLAHDAASVDGYSASTGTTANTIPVRDASGKLPGDILGNAATASKAAALSATNPIATGGTGATSAEQARTNLGTPPKNHASSSSEFGVGTSTQYGHLMSHDAPDATKTAATGHAFSPAGAAAMKDAQRSKDAAQDEAIAVKLSVSGGTMTGPLEWSNGMLRQNGDSLELVADKTNQDECAFIALRSINGGEPGWFRFGARTPERVAMGVCKPDGTFTWNDALVLTTADSATIAGYAMPHSADTDLAIVSSGGRYTAPYNGWFYVEFDVTNATDHIRIVQPNLYYNVTTGNTTTRTGVIVPVYAGEVIQFEYTSGATIAVVKFLKSAGAV